MRVLFRHVRTGRYFRYPDQWTRRKEEATDFRSGVHALGVASELKLRDVEMLLSFEDARYDIRLPVGGPEPRGREGHK